MPSLSTKNYIVGQFVFICALIVREKLVQGITNIAKTFNDPVNRMLLPEMPEHFTHFSFPILLSHLFMDTGIAINRHLVIGKCQVEQHAIALRRGIHLQLKKQFGSSVNGINIAAPRFYKNAQFAAGALLRSPQCGKDLLLLGMTEKFSLLLPGK